MTTMTIIIQNRLAVLQANETYSSKVPFYKRWFTSTKQEHKEPTIMIRV